MSIEVLTSARAARRNGALDGYYAPIVGADKAAPDLNPA
jgi:hypothetical protein